MIQSSMFLPLALYFESCLVLNFQTYILSVLLKDKVFLTSLQPMPVPTVCLMASHAQVTPYWTHVACLMASEAQLEWTQKCAIARGSLGSSLPPQPKQKGRLYVSCKKGKSQLYISMGQEDDSTDDANYREKSELSDGEIWGSPVKFCDQILHHQSWHTRHYVSLDMVQSAVQIFICEILLPKCLIYISWSLLYLRFSLQEIQGVIRNMLSDTMKKQSYKSRSGHSTKQLV